MGHHHYLRHFLLPSHHERYHSNRRPNRHYLPAHAAWSSTNILMQAISMPFVTRYAKKVSASMTCFVAGIAMSFIMYLSSFAQNFTSFALLFGLGNGVIIGIIYILPIGHCHQFFPKKKTTVSIIIVSASGIGTLIFSLIASDCMNFNNLTLE